METPTLTTATSIKRTRPNNRNSLATNTTTLGRLHRTKHTAIATRKKDAYKIHEIAINRNSTATDDNLYGLTLTGYCPCIVDSVTYNSVSYLAGVEQFDHIMKINDVNCCRATLKTCLGLIKNSQVSLHLTVYRYNEPKIKNPNKLSKTNIKKISKNKKLNRGFRFSKIFRPALWLPCTTNIKLNRCAFNEITLNQTYYSSSKRPFPPKKSDSQLTTKTSSSIGADTGYETASEASKKTVTSLNEKMTDAVRTQLIENLLEIEITFISYLSMGVAQLARPLRGFLMKQQDYFILFQNIEKILIISENFMRSMDKWSNLDLYTRIGQLYTQKLSLFREAFTVYAKGHSTSKCRLNELKTHSHRFRLFVKETQSGNLTLNNLIDLPLIHIQETLECFKQIKKFCSVTNQNTTNLPYIDTVIDDLRSILAHAVLASSLSLENADDEAIEENEEVQYKEFRASINLENQKRSFDHA